MYIPLSTDITRWREWGLPSCSQKKIWRGLENSN